MSSREEKLHSQALEFELQGKVKEAEELYQEILKINPQNKRAKYRLSIIETTSERKKEQRGREKQEIEKSRNSHIHIIRKSGLKDKIPIQDEIRIGSYAGDYQIVQIDFSPLISWPDLYSFDITCIDVQNLDISPLANHTNLHHVKIRNNHLGDFDLSPFGSCSSLQELSLAYNGLKRIDLSPLSSCPNFQHLRLERNEIESVDITPIIFHPFLARIDTKDTATVDTQEISLQSWIDDPYRRRRLQTLIGKRSGGTGSLSFSVKPPAPKGSWELLHKLASIPQTKSISIQTYILKALELQAFGFIDTDISEFLCSIPPRTSIENVREILQPFLVKTICEQIDNGGTTIGLDVESLYSDFRDIAYRIDAITQLREEENKRRGGTEYIQFFEYEEVYEDEYHDVDDVVSEHMVPRYDISQIALTAYGFAIATSLNNMKVLSPDMSATRKKAARRDMSDWRGKDLRYDRVLGRSIIVCETDFTSIHNEFEKLGHNLSERPHYTKQDLLRYWYEPKNMSIQMMHHIRGLVIHGWPDTQSWS